MKKDNKCELCGIHRDEMDSMPIEYYDVFKGKHMFICNEDIKRVTINISEHYKESFDSDFILIKDIEKIHSIDVISYEIIPEYEHGYFGNIIQYIILADINK